MNNWINPIENESPFFTSNKNFTKIAVDRVRVSDDSMHNVLLLATGILVVCVCDVLVQMSTYRCSLCDFLHARD